MKISVNCPSYKRPKVETLDYLPYCKVWVAEREADEYLKANPGFKKNIIAVPNEVQGNVSRIRNYILDKELPNNDVVCIVDDDINKICRYENVGTFGYKEVEISSDELLIVIERYSELCEEFGFKLWGVNCNGDKMSYRQTTPFSTVSVILGPFSCHLHDSDIRYDERLPLKEDYDISIQHINNYRGVLRVNSYFYNCKQSKQSGGCATYRNYDREKNQLEMLQKKWGERIVKIDTVTNSNTRKAYKNIDYNPIIKIPIKGV